MSVPVLPRLWISPRAASSSTRRSFPHPVSDALRRAVRGDSLRPTPTEGRMCWGPPSTAVGYTRRSRPRPRSGHPISTATHAPAFPPADKDAPTLPTFSKDSSYRRSWRSGVILSSAAPRGAVIARLRPAVAEDPTSPIDTRAVPDLQQQLVVCCFSRGRLRAVNRFHRPRRFCEACETARRGQEEQQQGV